MGYCVRLFVLLVWNVEDVGPAMQRIAEWLEKLGMSEYALRLAENGNRCSVLRCLTPVP